MSGGSSGPGNGADAGMANQTGPQVARIQVIGQYIKDLSFENPGAPGTGSGRPQIDLSVDLQARQMDTEHYEVEMKLRVSASGDSKPLFLLELAYAGLFHLHNVPQEARQPLLLIEAPHILFPFARRIVADLVRDGGMPPLMIEPIDFASLYRAKASEMQQVRMGAAGPQPS